LIFVIKLITYRLVLDENCYQNVVRILCSGNVYGNLSTVSYTSRYNLIHGILSENVVYRKYGYEAFTSNVLILLKLLLFLSFNERMRTSN